jgi:murein DD-endopeptidase MepM/ murein hydrolase activator NlpD
MTRAHLRPSVLLRRILLPPLLAGFAAVSVLVVLAASGSQGASKASNPLGGRADPVQAFAADLEGTPTAADIRRARRPLSERKRLLAAHPYFALYKLAKRRFDVPWLLVASIHYQETGFGKAPAALEHEAVWSHHKYASRSVRRPRDYPNRSARHPSVHDDFDVVMAIAADLKASRAHDLGASAVRAADARYGTDPQGRLSAAMVVERARAWAVLGTLPLPGRGELATPVRGVVPGCGYFGCPRPGHLHNGIDLLAPTGTPIHAADDGTVALLQSIGESGGYGNFLCLQHRPHLATCYAHMSAVAAAMRIGAKVKRGEVVGLVGQTGSASAPHLHFEVRRGPAACQTCAVDPAPFLDGQVPQAVVPEMVGAIGPSGGGGGGGPVAVAPPAAAAVTGSSGDPAPAGDGSEDGAAEHARPTPDLRPPSAHGPTIPPDRTIPKPAPPATTQQPPPAPEPVPSQPETVAPPPAAPEPAAPDAAPAPPEPTPAPPPPPPAPDPAPPAAR